MQRTRSSPFIYPTLHTERDVSCKNNLRQQVFTGHISFSPLRRQPKH